MLWLERGSFCQGGRPHQEWASCLRENVLRISWRAKQLSG